MFATTSTLINPPRQALPARPQTPPADAHDSSPTSPTNTIPSSSSHSHQTQASSSLATTETAASSPEVPSTALPFALEPPKGFVPAPSFSIARAPRYPGWRPDLEAGSTALGPSPTNSNKRTSVYMKPGGGVGGSQTPTTTTSPPYSPNAKDNIPPLPSLATLVPPSPTPKFTPKKPLSPNHLVRIANALGVQVPTPIGGTLGERSTSVSRSVSNGIGSSLSAIRRPSSANSNRGGINQRGVVNTATRFLIYVVPPSHLTADLVGIAGLANQFRRGCLLPLHATLSSQLTAIAREYSLPSTQGLVVYLLDIKHDVMGDEGQSIGEEWLGPRIGDDAWRLLWSGMLKAERETFERTMALQRQALSSSPSLLSAPGLAFSSSAPSHLVNGTSSPAESVESLPVSSGEPSPKQPSATTANVPRSASLRPLLTEQFQQEAAQRAASPFMSHTRSETMRSESPSASSIKTTTSAVSPLLPSLPIVGKIEFDIDMTKAQWYDNWAKRPRTRTTSATGLALGSSEPTSAGSRSPLIPLQLGTIPPIVGSSTGKSPARKLPPSPLQPISTHLDVEAAQPSSNLLTPASARFFGANSSRSSTSLSSEASEEEQTGGVPRNSLLLQTQAQEEVDNGKGDSAVDEPISVTDDAGYEALADETSEKEDDDHRLSDNEGPFDEDTGPNEDSEVDQAPADGRDPLGDVFPTDGETWSGIHAEMVDDPDASPRSDARMHPDRAEYLGRPSEDSDFTEELTLPDTTVDDFQEVLDLLNAKQQQTDLAGTLPSGDASLAADVTLGEFQVPPLGQVPISVLRSPIILDEHNADTSEPEYLPSPESTTSMESNRSRRPAPLILGPSDKIPSILEGLQPTPPGRHSLRLDTGFTDDPSTPQPPQRDSTLSSDGFEFGDEYAQEKELKKQLDELERSISSLSPRELSPSPLVTERTPGRSRHGTPTHSLNGANGPRFRSEALGVELAHKLAGGYVSSSVTRNASPNWPAVPFEKSSPMFTSSPNSTPSARPETNSLSVISEETRVRSHLQAEEEQLAASRKYRPPTPANKDVLAADPTPPLSILTTMPPIPIAPRISSVSSPKNSSRFSADSAASEENGKGSSVVGRSLRKLWRKSGAAAQASARLNAAGKQSAARNAPKDDPPLPPIPQANPSVQPPSLRQELRPERPDSGQDPFFFDQQSPYPTFRATSPSGFSQSPYRDSQTPRAPAPGPTPTANKTRSILKGRRASPPSDEVPQAEGWERVRDSRRSPPAGLATPDMTHGGQKLSPSAFPRTASSRTSFDVEETTYRPSMDSGDPLTPRLSQFEIVSPRGKSFELEQDRRTQANWQR